MSRVTPGVALHTDHYEISMLDAALASGVAHRRAVFEVFARALPPGRRYGAVGGIGRLVAAVTAFRFDSSQLAFLDEKGLLTPASRDYLSNYRFGGTVRAYEEGELYFPGSPVLTVEASFGEGLLIETLVLSILNHDSAVASAASRMVAAAAGRPLIEMGSRRTHEQAAVAAARVAYGMGFASTSNLEAGRLYGIPTAGTAAHALVLAHADERSAFEAQVEALGAGTTLLVDTFDTGQGIRTAVEVAGPGLGAIRIDSGELRAEARNARELLDSLGASRTRIVVSGDLDEFGIDALRREPIDAYGVGTKLVGGSGYPTANMVYKLVAMEDATGQIRPVAKRSPGKQWHGGRKCAVRVLDRCGKVTAENLGWPRLRDGAEMDPRPPGEARYRPLQRTYIVDGEVRLTASLGQIRSRHAESFAELPQEARQLSPGPPWVEAEMDTSGLPLRGVEPALASSGTWPGYMRGYSRKEELNMVAEAIDIVIEIPQGSRNKYEFDHELNAFRLDRRLFSATVYPADYGFLPGTLAEDGDPLDALVLLADPTFPGCVVRARPVGIFWMTDEKGPDAKLVCVPEGDPTWDGVNELEELPAHLLNEIRHFFDVYKDLEPDKSSSTAGYEGAEAAARQIEVARKRASAAG